MTSTVASRPTPSTAREVISIGASLEIAPIALPIPRATRPRISARRAPSRRRIVLTGIAPSAPINATTARIIEPTSTPMWRSAMISGIAMKALPT
jgi:hypothetical protein